MTTRRFGLPQEPDAGQAAEIRDEVATLPGVDDVQVRSGERLVVVEADEAMTTDDELLASIGRVGIEATLLEGELDDSTPG